MFQFPNKIVSEEHALVSEEHSFVPEENILVLEEKKTTLAIVNVFIWFYMYLSLFIWGRVNDYYTIFWGIPSIHHHSSVVN